MTFFFFWFSSRLFCINYVLYQLVSFQERRVCYQMKIWATGILILTSHLKCSLKFIIIIHSFSSHYTMHTNIRRITIVINTNRKSFSLNEIVILIRNHWPRQNCILVLKSCLLFIRFQQCSICHIVLLLVRQFCD